MRNPYAYAFRAIIIALVIGLGIYKGVIEPRREPLQTQVDSSTFGETTGNTPLSLEEDPFAPPAVEKLMIDISDIPAKANLTGKLGVPLGTLITVTGVYHGDARYGDDHLYFHAETINGQKLTDRVIFDSWQMMPFMQGIYGVDGTHYDGDTYDWRFKINGAVTFKKGSPGERYELLGVETGGYYLGANPGLTVPGAMFHYGAPEKDGAPFNFDKYVLRQGHLSFQFETIFEVIAYKKLAK